LLCLVIDEKLCGIKPLKKQKRSRWGVFAHSIRVACGGWLCDLGAVGASSIFGLVRGAGSFAAVLPTLVLVSRIQLAQRYRDFGHFLSATSSSRLKTMVGVSLVKTSAFRFGLGVSGATIVSGSCGRPSQSWMSCLLTSSLSLGTSSLICRATQCM
jgi:hypothetical protein